VSARLRAIATETVEIVRRGGYTSPVGTRVDISADIARALAGTRVYLPADPLPAADEDPPPTAGQPATAVIEVTTESTLDAGRRLGPGTAALVFASARNPGGGFRRGARAQEEDIARASALQACLMTVPDFYAYHRAHVDLRYSDRVIYSPDVPVFREHGGVLLDNPYRLSLLTAAAPNRGAIGTNQSHLLETVPATVTARADRVLQIAAAHGHRTLVLGAWGCGVFANSPAVVAAAFRTALTRTPRFDRVVFAILDHTGNGPTYRAFVEAFAKRIGSGEGVRGCG
jgi:uncharacterized protein (TIGR02452 family)